VNGFTFESRGCPPAPSGAVGLSFIPEAEALHPISSGTAMAVKSLRKETAKGKPIEEERRQVLQAYIDDLRAVLRKLLDKLNCKVA
jgi:hypothetical protein